MLRVAGAFACAFLLGAWARGGEGAEGGGACEAKEGKKGSWWGRVWGQEQELPKVRASHCCNPSSTNHQPPLLLKKVSQYTSHLSCNTPPICIPVLLVPLDSKEREILSALLLSVLLPFVSQYCNTPPICIAVLWGKSCPQDLAVLRIQRRISSLSPY